MTLLSLRRHGGIFLVLVFPLMTCWLRAADIPGELREAAPVPAGLTMDQIRDVSVVSLKERGYTVKETLEDRVVGYLVHRGYEATLTLTFDTRAVVIYCEAWKVDRSTSRRIKPAQPEDWVERIKSDVFRRMMALAPKS